MFRILPPALVTVPLALFCTSDLARAQCRSDVTAFDGDVDNGFGHSADMEGSLTAVGAPHDDVMGQYSGSVYVLDAVTGQGHYKISASNGQDNELFGWDVAIDDGLLVVGAPGIIGQDWGPTRVYDVATGNELSQLYPNVLLADSFGYSVAVDDGLVVVGDYKRERAHVFDALTGVELYSVEDPSSAPDSHFAFSVAIAGNRVVVGAGVFPNEIMYGRVFVYEASTGQPLYELEQDEGGSQFFGWTVATAGSRLVVGSTDDLNVYDLATGAHLKEIECPSPSIVAAEGLEALVTDGLGSKAYVIDLVQGEVKYTLESYAASSLTMGAGRWLVCHGGGGFNETADLWDVVDADGDGFFDCRDVGTSYCGPANPNSTGASAWIAAEGSTLVAEGDLRLRALSLPLNQAGYFLASRTQGFIPFAGGSQGNLCVSGQVGRYTDKVKNSGANGRFTMKVDLAAVPPGMQAVLPGEDWNFQAWYRDANPSPTSNFTDGVNILFQ